MDTAEFKSAYALVLAAFVESREEAHLAEAAELGREMVRAGVPPEEIAEIHETALQRLAKEFPDKTLLEFVQRISAPLMEMLMAYGLAFREQQDERKRAEKALRDREQQLAAILESAADGILVVDEKGQVIHSNARFIRMWRIPANLIEAKDDRKLLAFVLDQLKDPEAFLSKVQSLYMSAEEAMDTIFFKDGRVFERLSHSLDREGGMGGRVWSFRDITDRRKTEEELAEHRQHLEERVRDRTEALRKAVNLMAGRENRMAELKRAIKKLRAQLEEAGMTPVADDSMFDGRCEKDERKYL